MITTTSYYKTAIKELSRNEKVKVELFFDGEDQPATVLGSDNIATIGYLTETQAEGETPLGAVSSDEIVLTLRNDEDQFISGNTTGPYYGKLLPNVKVIPYYGLQISDLSFEWISLGEYWTSDWDADTGEPFATVVCHDLLYKTGEKDVPLIPTMQNITRYQMWETLFRSIGLSGAEYSIDAVLTSDSVPIAFYPKGKVRTAMTDMAEAFNCNVTISREGIITVTSNNTLSASVLTMQDTDLIFNSNMPQDFEKVYSEVNVKYSQYTLGELQSILKLENVEIPAAGITLNNLEFTSSPVAFVGYIRINNAVHISIGDISIGTWGMSLQIDNSVSANMTIDIEVFGHPMEVIQDEVEVQDATAYGKVGSKKLYLKNYLVQTSEAATTYATRILALVSDETAYLVLSTRGDPSLELNDVITAIDATHNLPSIEVVPIRYDYGYDGGLGCEILAIKKSIREAS